MLYKTTIKKGNLITEEADFIVNASNTRLILGSGVSMAFKRHCGIQLQTELDAILGSMDGELQQGDVVVSSSANATNFKYALNVAVMNYNRGVRQTDKLPTLKTIEQSLQNIQKHLLLYAEKHSKSLKIAIPLMGCGVGGLDKVEVIKLYHNFFSQPIEIECEVIIYGYSDEDYKLISSYFKADIII